MADNQTLFTKLQEYGQTDSYPFHMPGHKRQVEMGITSFPNPFSVDITEIDGFDNLHHPEGILKTAMEQAADLYVAQKTYYLVNGSTCGILSALCAAVHPGGRILLARNSHKAAYHAALLNDMEAVYLYPECIEAFGIQGGISPEMVEEALGRYEGVEAVFITSPTFEGLVSDVQAIAKTAHSYGIPLIVDEAHGAHFSFGDGAVFPQSALSYGADMVIQSLHKTLPSLTQTAVLHVKSELVSYRRVEQYLQIFESSSPSYVLLSSIDNCIRYMGEKGRKRLDEFGSRLKLFMEECTERLHFLKLLTDDFIGTNHVKERDISKILVSTKEAPITGVELAAVLREQYHLEPEMSCCSYVLLMTSLMDSEKGLKRLRDALIAVDEGFAAAAVRENVLEEVAQNFKPDMLTWISNPVRCLKLAKAMDSLPAGVKISEAVGRISGCFITVYPPGIPAVVPGELITDEVINLITYHGSAGLTVEGVSEDGDVFVVEEG